MRGNLMHRAPALFLLFGVVVGCLLVPLSASGQTGKRVFGLLEWDSGQAGGPVSSLSIAWGDLGSIDWLSLYPIRSGNGAYPGHATGEPLKITVTAWFGETGETVVETFAGEIPLLPVRAKIVRLERGNPQRLSLSLVGAAPASSPAARKYLPAWRILVVEGRKPRTPRHTMMLATDGSGRPSSRISRGSEMLQAGQSLHIEVAAGTLRHWSVIGATRTYPRKEAVLYRGSDPLVGGNFLQQQARSLLGVEGSFLFDIVVNVDDPPQPGVPCVVFLTQAPSRPEGGSFLAIDPTAPVEALVLRHIGRTGSTGAATAPAVVGIDENSDQAFLGSVSIGPGGTGSSFDVPWERLSDHARLTIIPETGEFLELVIEGESGSQRRELLRTATWTVDLARLRRTLDGLGWGGKTRLSFQVNPRPLRVEKEQPVFAPCQVVLKVGSPVPPYQGSFLSCDGRGFSGSISQSFRDLRPDDVFAYQVCSGTFLYWHFLAKASGQDGGVRSLLQGTENHVPVSRLLELAREAGLDDPRHLFLAVNGSPNLGEPTPCTAFVYRIPGREPTPAEQQRERRLASAPVRAADLRVAAEGGDLEACCDLGSAFRSGIGVPRDAGQAVLWWTKAAEGGHRRAQAILGGVYLTGQPVPRDPDRAAKWLAAAARQGEDGVFASLGHLHEPPDPLDDPVTRKSSVWRSVATDLFQPERLVSREEVARLAKAVRGILDWEMDADPAVEGLVETLVAAGDPEVVTLVLTRIREDPSLAGRWMPHLRLAFRFAACREVMEQARAGGLELPGWEGVPAVPVGK